MRRSLAHRSRLSAGMALAVLLVLAACGAPAPQGTAPGQTAAAEANRTRPLHIAHTNEPSAIAGKFGGGRSGLIEYDQLFAAQLVRTDYQNHPTPQLAAELPSLDRGTWKTFPDGTMETTYRLRPGLTWHDGEPFTADDVVFTWRAVMDPNLSATNRDPERYIDDMQALDAETVVMHWTQPNIFANDYETTPLPKHLLEPLVQRDPQSFLNASYWTTDWVGLGPYKVGEWAPGSFLKGEAFAGYVLGEPPIREIVVHFIFDATQGVASVLSGSVDMTMGSLLKIEEGVLLRDQWEARGEGKIMTPPDQVRVAEIQFRDPNAPFARDVQARRALFHALDRPLMVSTLHYGLTKVANSYVSPEDAGWSAVEDAIAKYPYDRAQALQLFAAAGWDRGPDGVLVNAAGERFQVNARTLDSPQYVKEAQVVVDQWRDVGVAAEIETYGRARQNDSEYRAKFQGVAFGSPSPDAASMLRWSSRELATEANGWKGQNRNAYVRPDVDQLLTRYFATIDPGPRNETLVQLFKFIADDLPALTLYYPVRVFAIRKGLAGVVPEKPGEGWEGFNAHQIHWE